MSVVKVIENRYLYPQDVESLVKYIFNGNETATSSYRYFRHLIFASPEIADVQSPGRVKRTAELFLHNHRIWNVPYGQSSIVHHEVISFAASEINEPDAWWLGVQISQKYFREGFINCFGAHTSTDNLHLHFAIDNISFETGRPFYIPNEANALRQMIDAWILHNSTGKPVPLSSCR